MLAVGFDSSRGALRRRAKILAALSVAALLLHAALLGEVPLAWPGRDVARPPSPAVTVRMLSAAPAMPSTLPARVLAAPRAAPPPPLAAQRPRPRPTSLATAAAAEPQPAATATNEPPPAAPEQGAAAPVIEEALPQAGPDLPAQASAAKLGGEGEIPVYRTRIPPPLTLHYTVRRGALGGDGELRWRPSGDGYDLQLEVRIAGFSVLTQASEGAFDDAGVAPLRFTDQRMRRAPLAANFRRDGGTISFSGTSTQVPLLAGAQDRLSWMIQLAAVASAEPQRLAEGGKVAMLVAGARGDASVWVFRYLQHESVQTEAGTVHAAKLIREVREAYDSQVEVWLDPLRHHLPVRASLRTGPDGEGLDLLLQDVVLVPLPP